MSVKLRKRKPTQSPSVLESARCYVTYGWNVVPLPLGQKNPVQKKWQKRRITLDNVADHFSDALQNIGLQFGERSNGLTDVDIDCREALALANILPPTSAEFGRPSKPRSHRLYITDLYKTQQKATLQFKDLDGSMLIELRVGGAGKGAQTMAPPSLHPSGERVEWDRDGKPARVDGKDLRDCVSTVAAAALLVRHYPAEGSRHDAALVLGGTMARIPSITFNDIEYFVSAVAKVAGDEEWKERGRSAAGAIDLLRRGDPTPGLPRMREVWGSDVAERFAEWMEIPVNKTEDDRLVTLACLDPIAYDQRRLAVANEMGVRVSTLDEQVKQCRASLAKRRAHSEKKPDLDQLAASAEQIIQCEDVLALFAEQFGKLVAGEEKNAKLLFLVGTSRLFRKPMHAGIKGPSAAGKSEVRTRTLDFFPPEDVIAFTALSEKALLYMPDDFHHKILSMGEAITGKEIEFQDYLLRELMSEGKLRYPVVQKNPDGELQTVTVEKEGPVAFLVTTTRNKLNPENETRMLSLEVDDSEAQTRTVMRKVAEVEGYINRSTSSCTFLLTGESRLILKGDETRRCSQAGSHDAGGDAHPRRAQRTGWRKPRGCRTIHADQPPYDIWLAGAVSARWLGSAESQAAFGQAAQTGCARLAMDLQHHHAEEPVATEVRLRAVDACHGGEADQG